jgi:hypothetical protein
VGAAGKKSEVGGGGSESTDADKEVANAVEAVVADGTGDEIDVCRDAGDGDCVNEVAGGRNPGSVKAHHAHSANETHVTSTSRANSENVATGGDDAAAEAEFTIAGPIQRRVCQHVSATPHTNHAIGEIDAASAAPRCRSSHRRR